MTILSAIKEVQQRTVTHLDAYLNNANIEDSQLKDAMQYSLLLGGKRVRPFLVYTTGTILGATLEDLDAPASAIEAIHTYSLIHDDLPAMDNDDLRRGQPTCHNKFDYATAILAGDALQSFAFDLVTSHDYQDVSAENQLKLVNIIAKSATKMCAGQSIDLLNTDKQPMTLASLEAMHNLKTGALIKASVLAGAITANANKAQINALTKYAEAIGLAFQVWDDVLDITSDTETLGKPQGSDEKANKSTYPALLGLDKAKLKAQQLVNEANLALELIDGDTSSLSQLAQYIIERDH
ncbi:(2E,6E)-farnesyl diphosphate synthase [Psychrosphaera sp.]|nr:(2E,6E)-farnesyl diphosphate synthase [Psychrosphaera sp.]